MNIHFLDEHKGVHHYFLHQLREVSIQQNKELFRLNLRKLGFALGVELAKILDHEPVEVHTLLGTAVQQKPRKSLVVATVLRAGIPLFEGLLDAFPQAESAFIGAFRKEQEGNGVEVESGYLASPSLKNKILILADPMLATGSSMVKAYEMISEAGLPDQLFLVSAVAAPEGVSHVKKNIASNMETTLVIASLDSHLNDQFFIVPGLGDAGDLAYGQKS